jgi:hypothetical protein
MIIARDPKDAVIPIRRGVLLRTGRPQAALLALITWRDSITLQLDEKHVEKAVWKAVSVQRQSGS